VSHDEGSTSDGAQPGRPGVEPTSSEVEPPKTVAPRRLSRHALGIPTPPVRIVHLGVGAFHRAHQAWYTTLASDAADWGIAAFTGRSAQVAQSLAAQDGLYTLTVRGPHTDKTEVVTSIVAAHSGDDMAALTSYLARPEVAIVTLTVTEAGYRLTAAGKPDVADLELAADIRAMTASMVAHATPTTAPTTAPTTTPTTTLGRLVTALDARRRADSGPLAVVPCDNVPDNGAWLKRGVLELASMVSSEQGCELGRWIETNVSFVSTSVDRITPRSVATDADAARLAGWIDASPVVTEPFSDWTISGEFPAGRPDWGSAGARFVEDIEPYERRKLWLLNGAHSLIAAAGINRGIESVSAACADPGIWAMVEAYWAEAVRHLPGIEHVRYREALRERFANPRIVHLLSQIGTDAATKYRVRAAAVAIPERAAGYAADGCAAAIAEWIMSTTVATEASDTLGDSIAAAWRTPDPVAELVSLLSSELARQSDFVDAVRTHVRTVSTPSHPHFANTD